MLFPEADAQLLTKWIVKRIENTSDADADVLAEYVLALLRHDAPIDEVRKLCEAEIPDFLKEDPAGFINDLFDAVLNKRYLPGAPPRPPLAAGHFAARPSAPATTSGFAAPAVLQGGLSYDDVSPAQRQGQAQGLNTQQVGGSSRGSRKRAWEADGSGQQSQQQGHNGDGALWQGRRAFKQAKRGGKTGRGEENGFQQAKGPESNSRDGQQPPQFPQGPYNSNAAMEAFFNLSGINQFLQQPPAGRKRQRCRDYDTKGYCSRGNTCPFQHGDDPTYVPLPLGAFGGTAMPKLEEYDPSNALLAQGFGTPNMGPMQPYSPEHKKQGRQKGQKRRPRAPFSAEGPVFDRTKSTIVVENIPEDCFSEEQVRDFFSQFGNITEVSMQAYKRLAIVKYDNWAAANAAYQSPKAIFDNRFVKVFWYREDDSSLVPPKSLNGNQDNASVDTENPPPVVDMEEFLQKQEEAQKAFEEKQQKLKEIERQRQELETQQRELLARQQEEKAKLEAKLAGRTNGATDSSDLKATKPMTQSEALRAQLAALEAEAKQLGIDPDAASEAGWAPPRGGYYGRGRGSYRARGYAPSGTFRGGFRGGFRGRSDQHAAYAMYSLDNRPKRVTIAGVDFTASEKDEALRHHLFGIGEFTDIKIMPNSTEITFKDRKTAEKFFNSVLENDKRIPGVDGQVEPAWVGGLSTPSPSIPGTPTAANPVSSTRANHVTQNNVSSKGGSSLQQSHTDDQDGGDVSSDKDVRIVLDRPADEMDYGLADYDVADANRWDIE